MGLTQNGAGCDDDHDDDDEDDDDDDDDDDVFRGKAVHQWKVLYKRAQFQMAQVGSLKKRWISNGARRWARICAAS